MYDLFENILIKYITKKNAGNTVILYPEDNII